jgi:hypothetical protein
MTREHRWQEKARPDKRAPSVLQKNIEAGGIPGGYCRVVTAITPPMLPVPNFVVASQER